MANSTKTKFQEYTQYLHDAFTTSTRSQEQVDRGMNKIYYMIDEDHVDAEEIRQNLIYPLHDEEWPNDWRYDTIHTLLCDFVDYEDRQEIEDHIHEIVDGSVDVYKRTSEDLLLDVPVSYTTGFPNALDNRGKVENRGIEIELKTKNVIRPNFQWNSTFIASRNENELLDFAESDGLITNVDTKRAAEWINLVGNPISSFYGWVVDTEIPDEYIKSPWERVRQTNREVYVKDLNGDGVIDDDDKTILGNPYPDLVWSISNEFNVGDFDLSFIFQGSHGAEVRNIGDQYLFRHFGSSSTALSSAPNQGFIKQKIFTDSIVQNASYVALRTISIGYDFPEDILTGLFITNARIYATGQNLLYITADDYNGLNPESIYNTSPINYGYQRVGSPINQTFSLGFNLNF